MRKTNEKAVTAFLLKYGTYILFLTVVLIMLLASDKFRTLSNMVNILLQNSTLGVMAVGMTLVIITGGIDVSVGAIMSCAACVGAVLIVEHGVNQWLGMLVIIAIATGFGFINGFAVAYLKMPAFLVTLATQSVGRGLALVISNGQTYRKFSDVTIYVGTASILGIPLLIWLMLIIMAVGYFLLHRTVYGRQVFATGGNAEAALVSGINTRKIEMSTYAILGFICGIASIMTVGRIGSYWTALGTGIEFDVIAGVVIGGTSLAGGSGNMAGTLVGVLLMGVIANALNLLGVDAYWQDVAKGAVIFLAVFIDAVRNRYARAE
ncbi:MAG TPA: ABC transporter permease [Feifaniaceae bacterium]|nr:ABC transporter permease [Feifaniaceae bacterium]